MATVGTRQHARLRRRRHRVTVALLLFAIVTVVAVRWGASHGDDSLGSSGNQSHYGASVDSAATAGRYAQQAGRMLDELSSAIGLGGGSGGGSAIVGGFDSGSGPINTEQRPLEDRELMLSDLSDAERQAVLQMRAAVRAPSQGCWNYSDTTAAAISVAVNNGVLVTTASANMADFFRNWLWWVRRAGITNVVVGVTDEASADMVAGLGITCVDLTPGLLPPGAEKADAAYFDYMHPGWKKLAWVRTGLCAEIMRGGLDVVWSDVDVVWFQNPFTLLAEHPEVDMMMGTDTLRTFLDKGDTGFEISDDVIYAHWNSGEVLMRHSPLMQRMLDEWALGETTNVTEVHDKEGSRQDINHDQDYLNWVVLRRGLDGERVLHPKSTGGGHVALPDWPRVILVYSKLLRIGIMPISRFMHGRTYFMQRLDRVKNVTAVALHAVWMTITELESKRGRLRENLLWHGEAEDSAYLSDGRYLSVDLAWPKIPYDENGTVFSEWVGDVQSKMEAWHVAGMDWQLSQMYYGVALATVLNRTLILPRMACFCDTAWTSSTNCRASHSYIGSRMSDVTLPYACAIDNVLRQSQFQLGFRLHSFLDEPNLDPQIRASQAVVRPEGSCTGDACKRATFKKCKAQPRVGQTARRKGAHRLPTYCIPSGLHGEQLAAAAEPLSDVRVLHVSRGQKIWGNFASKKAQDKLTAHAAELAHRWEGRDPAPELAHLTMQANRTYLEPYQVAPFQQPEFFDDVMEGRMPMTDLLQHRVFDNSLLAVPSLEIRNWEVDASVYTLREGDDGSNTLDTFDALGAFPPAIQARTR